MEKISLLFGIHMHQPVDNFGEAVDEAVRLCYKPFFETMVGYPEFKFSVHCSGWLLDFIMQKHPDIFANMKTLTQNGSIEWIGAGYYEPVLSAIPSKDRVAQINMLTTFIEKNLGVKPKGLWLTERVWESSIIPDIVSCGLDFVVVDDYHFLSSGYDNTKMDGYYTTEEGGVELGLFPISKALRYALPFFTPEKAIETVLDAKKSANSAAIIFDDGEKFGLWPETHEWVYNQKWLCKFVEGILSNQEIETLHYATYKEQNRSLGIAYLNNTSYIEMGEWSLEPTHAIALEELKEKLGKEYFDNLGVAFLKGGIWKNFFIKYLESNYLHKRMLYFSLKQKQMNAATKDSLYRLQTNDVFWHGVFGGLYLPNLRDNAYNYLLKLEKAQAKKKISYEVLDIDKDGYEELKVLTSSLSMVFSSKHGGQMMEFGSLHSFFNWQNTLMRRKEAYHEKMLNPKTIATEHTEQKDGIDTIHKDVTDVSNELVELLHFDWHPKYSFIDHFSADVFTMYGFSNLATNEIGDFADKPFEFNSKNNSFKRDGGIFLDKKYHTSVEKNYTFEDKKLTLDMRCQTDCPNKIFYAQELNFHFAHPYKSTFNGKMIGDGFSEYGIDCLTIVDDFTRQVIRIKTNQKCDVFAYVLYTVSQSEIGFDKVAQGVSFIFTLPMQSKLKLSLELELLDV
ncbi:MAG: DUF1926 domain-containing protein [Sulfurimonadaceae bacterium]|jgi:hypothetical protein|nr:DUF1926 domain-containing protein [Sulfurimonadaceae bacterium]